MIILRLLYRYYIVEDKQKDNLNPESERKLFDRIVKYTGVFGSVQGVSMLVSLVLTKFKSVLLGPEGYGITESLNRSADLIRSATNLGIATVAIPEISRCTGSEESDALAEKVLMTRSWALLTAIAGMVLCLFLAPLLSRWAFDGDRSFTAGFMALSLAVAATAVTGGELAVLRGTGMLKQIAMSQLISGLLSLIISVPLYWIFGIKAIVPVLVAIALGTMLVTLFYSNRRFGYRACPFNRSILAKGTGMIGFGIFLTVTAFLGAWAWSYIARYLTGVGGAQLTGSYSAGYMLVTYLTTLLLAVNDSEYYPRLSAAGNNMAESHNLMNNQAMAMCMLAAPVVIVFMLCLPAVVFVILEYDKFQDTILLAQMAVVGLYFKAVSQPIAYLVLAQSDSRIYILQETLCYILLVVCVVTGYRLFGIIGLGASFAVWELLYLVLVLMVSRVRYGYVMSVKLVKCFLTQGILVMLAVTCVCMGSRVWLIAGFLMCLASVAVSLRFFSRHTSFLSSLLSKTKRH